LRQRCARWLVGPGLVYARGCPVVVDAAAQSARGEHFPVVAMCVMHTFTPTLAACQRCCCWPLELSATPLARFMCMCMRMGRAARTRANVSVTDRRWLPRGGGGGCRAATAATATCPGSSTQARGADHCAAAAAAGVGRTDNHSDVQSACAQVAPRCAPVLVST
jgi:hypothetical protein